MSMKETAQVIKLKKKTSIVMMLKHRFAAILNAIANEISCDLGNVNRMRELAGALRKQAAALGYKTTIKKKETDMNLNDLAKKVTLKEGKKESLSIAQVKEVMSILLGELAAVPEAEAIKTIRAYRKKAAAPCKCAAKGKK
jgi:hypothetical protein